MTGHLYAFNAEIQGTINSSNINSSNLYSPYIATQNNAFPRIELNSTSNLLRAMKDSQRELDIMILPSQDVPGLRFWDQSAGKTSYLYLDSFLNSLNLLANDSDIQISASGGNTYISGTNVIINGKSFEAKADKSSRSGTIYVASTPGGPANTAITVANGVLQ